MTLRLIFALLAAVLIASTALAQSPSTVQQNAFSYTTTGVPFAYLATQCGSGTAPPSPPNCAPQYNGSMIYCKDCAAGPLGSCVGGGSGLVAKHVGSAWQCADVAVTGGNMSNYSGPIYMTGSSGNGSDQISNVNINGVANVKAYGAYGDLVLDLGKDCSMNAGLPTLSCTTAPFKATDIGKRVFVPGLVTQPITGAVSNGGLIQLTVTNTALLNAANRLIIEGLATGTTEANGSWAFTINDSSHITLTGSTYTHAYTSGGSIYNVRTPTLDTTITAFTSSTSVTIGASPTVAVSGQNIAYGHDDTAAIQSTYNDGTHNVMYFPPGNYLNRGQNWTSGNKATIYGDNQYGATVLVSLNVTDPGGNPGATSVGVQHAGYADNINGISFMGGFQSAPDTSPLITFLSARTSNTSTSPQFNIDHSFNDDYFQTYAIDGYGLVLYGAEQTHLFNCGVGNSSSSKGIMYVSACNTPGFVAPYNTLVAAPTSMTKVGWSGTKSIGSGQNAGLQNGGALFMFDDACNPFSIYQERFQDAFVNQANSVTFRDTYTGSGITEMTRHFDISQWYVETQTPNQDYFINWGALFYEGELNNVAFFAPSAVGAPPFNFRIGFQDSRAKVDSSGPASGAAIFTTPTCLLSTLDLGEQSPIAANCSDWLSNLGATNGLNFWNGSATVAAPQIQPLSIGSPGTGGATGALRICTGSTASVSGGGVLAAGSNSYAGTITGIAATANTITMANCNCANQLVPIIIDQAGSAITIAGATGNSVNYSGTAGHNVSYQLGCR
jgi:hypothetical protein